MRIGSLIAVACLVAAGCKDKPAGDARAHAEGAVGGEAPSGDLGALARCGPAIEASRAGGAAALLDGCTPCGVGWQPLVALSAFDPDVPPPDDLPAPTDVLAVLDACKASCTGTARTELTEILGEARIGKYPSKPWRKLAEACRGSLELDDRDRRYARGTWYALAQIAKALWSADVPAAVATARDAAPLEFALPPFSEASTALAVPKSDVLAAAPPRLHVTIDQATVRIGALPFVRLADGKAGLAPAPGTDYPGAEVGLDKLDHELAALVTESSKKPYSFDLSLAPVLIAPRGMPAKRLLEVLFRMPGSRAYLGATATKPAGNVWPEPLGAIPIFISTAPPFPDLPLLDATDPAIQATIDALPSTASAVRVVFAADATVEAVGHALTALAAHGVDRAALELKPAPP